MSQATGAGGPAFVFGGAVAHGEESAVVGAAMSDGGVEVGAFEAATVGREWDWDVGMGRGVSVVACTITRTMEVETAPMVRGARALV